MTLRPRPTPGSQGPEELKAKVSGALRWSFVNSVFTRLAQLAVGVVLAHLIAPREFGIYAAALVVINITLSISELGASVALVRHRGDPGELAPTVATIALASSGALALMTFLFAPIVADALGAPEATGVVRLLSVALLTSGLSAVPGAMLQREFRQDHKLLADAISFLLSTGVVIVLALNGLGPWALAWSRIVANLASAVVMTRLTTPRFWPGFNWQKAREILHFSLPLAGASLLVFAVMNVDYIVVGAVLGPVQLGFYLIAFNLSSWPVTAFSSTIRSVSVAGFAQLQQDEQTLRDGFSRSLGLLMTLTVPTCVLLAALASPLIRFVYGDRWLPSAAPLAVLSVLGALRVALELAYDYLAAVGATRVILAIHGLWLVALVPALLLGAHHGDITGVSWGHVVTIAAIVTPAYLVALSRIGLPTASLLPGLIRPSVGGVAMSCVAILVSHVLHADFWVLAVGGVASVLVYGAVVLPGDTGLIRQRARATQRAPAP